MRLLKRSVVASIAVLGAILVMASSETEDRSYSTAAGDVGHRNEDSVKSSSRSTGERCVGKVGIEVVAHEAQSRNVAGMDAAATYSICKWKNTTEESSEKFEESSKQFAVQPKSAGTSIDLLPGEKLMEDDDQGSKAGLMGVVESFVTSLTRSDTHKPLDVAETTKIITPDSLDLEATIESVETSDVDVLHGKRKSSSMLRLQNQLLDREKTRQRRPTSTSRPITQRARSARLISLSNTSESSTRNSSEASMDTNESTEEALESPLIVSSPRALGTRLSTKEKSLEGDDKQPYLKKDHSKPSINLVDGMANKVFYEIKPSLNTAMEEEEDDDMEQTSPPIITTTKRNFLAGFKLPSVPSSFGKFGPYFLDELDRRNITERIGSTVMLDCRIGLLGDKKVTWLQHDKDSIRLLTVGNVQYSADERISLKFQYPDNWRLQIVYATLRDSGLYKCQVEIDPMHSLVKRYNVFITAPILNITDDSGRVISGERHLKAGSALRLRCEGRDVLERLNESLLWTRGDETLTSNVSENRTTEIVGDKELPLIVSTLTVERATPRHAGNYSCIVPERAKTTIAVHVLNGELPAAVHHGNGVSSAVLNLWLIHLTASYGLFR